MRPDIPPEKFVKWLKQLPEEVVRHGNAQEHKQAEEDYKKFVECFNKGECSLCGKPLKTFSANSPCLHWLLRPKKFKKKHFSVLYHNFTYFRIAAYVRWAASIDSPMKNINDIMEEHPGGKLIDFTAKHRHLTWSFSCGETDYKGHNGKAHGNTPHYHMQMNLDGKQFINYNDFHIPFHDDDLYHIELFTNHSDKVKHSFGHGSGMQDIMGSKEGLEFIIDHSDPTDDQENAAFNINTLIMAPEGETISGDLLADAINEAKTNGKTIASVLRNKLEGTNASITSIVSPGDGVPESKQRPGRKKGKR